MREGDGCRWRGMLLKLPLLIRWANFSAARETFKFAPDANGRRFARVHFSSGCRWFFFILLRHPSTTRVPKGVSVARGYPFVQDAPAPFRPFASPRPRPRLRSSMHQIKPPCRRVYLAFYRLICLATTVTTSRKTTSSIFVRETSAVHSTILNRHQRRTSCAQSLLPLPFLSFFCPTSLFAHFLSPLYSSDGKR